MSFFDRGLPIPREYLLSIFGKIFEKTMHTRLYSFITKYKILYDLQFGFSNNHSTILATIDIVECIRDALDKVEKVLGIYLDLQKAFDTVDHHILIQKLSHYGIRSKWLSWFSSYLSSRSQFVTVNNAQSEYKNIKHWGTSVLCSQTSSISSVY